MTSLSVLCIEVTRTTTNYPTVRLLVDGEEPLRKGDGNDPARLLDTQALVPRTPPVRVAFYGCTCGDFGCSNVAGLVEAEDRVVQWRDFRSITGGYDSALPDPEEWPDPLEHLDEDDRFMARWLPLPDLRFDAGQYRAEVDRASADRSWETRARAVARLVAQRRPATTLWAAPDGDRVQLQHRSGGMAAETTLDVPAGPVDRLAGALVALLDDDVHPEQIARRRLWR